MLTLIVEGCVPAEIAGRDVHGHRDLVAVGAEEVSPLGGVVVAQALGILAFEGNDVCPDVAGILVQLLYGGVQVYVVFVTEEAVGAGALCHVPHVAGGQQLYAVAGTDIVRFCSHKGVNNQREIDKGEKDNIEFIIAGENAAKAFDSPK